MVVDASVWWDQSTSIILHGILKYSFRYTVVVGAGGYTLLHRISPLASLNSSTFYFSEKMILSTVIELIESTALIPTAFDNEPNI